MSHVLLMPFGTAGSIHPFVWLGRLLRRGGHRVTMVTGKAYAELAAQAGLGFQAVEGGELQRMLDEPRLWQGHGGSCVAYRHAGRSTAAYVAAVETLLASGEKVDLMLAPMICFGARLMREKRRIPLVNVHLYPMMFVSAHELPLALPGFRLLRRMPLALRKAVLGFPNPLDAFALPAVRRACGKHQVRKPWSLWKQWWHSPDGVLALFPQWFARPQPDWPQNLLQWDFPLEDLAGQKPMPADLAAFLDAGEPPVLFTAGTGQFHAHEFFATAARMVRQLGCRAVFLTSKPEQLPEALPETVFVCRYAPFSRLLPRSRAFVHHGGIGTVAQCLAAGIPQLIVAMALDQPDNARRIEAIGAGLAMHRRDFTLHHALPMLQRCLTEPHIRETAGRLAATHFAARDPGPLVEWLESRFTRLEERSLIA